MPPRNRLARADFARLGLKRRREHGKYFSLVIAALPGAEAPKIACVVGKKVVARAVSRNAIERRCREALRPLVPTLPKGLALVFYAKREAREASFSDIARDMRALLARAATP
jgi:ribonuclease P protein component